MGLQIRDDLVRQCHEELKKPYLVESIMDVLIALQAVNPLIKLLAETTSDYVRGRAASALGEIKSERAVDSLLRLLAETAPHDVRRRAADALGTIKSERAVDPLTTLMLAETIREMRG